MNVLPRSLTWQIHDIGGSVFGVASERGTCVGVGTTPKCAILRAVTAARQQNVAVDFVDGGRSCESFQRLMQAWAESNQRELPASELLILRRFFQKRG